MLYCKTLHLLSPAPFRPAWPLRKLRAEIGDHGQPELTLFGRGSDNEKTTGLTQPQYAWLWPNSGKRLVALWLM